MFSSPSFADDQSLTNINNFSTKQNIQKKKYTLKAKFSEKNSRDLERFKVLNLSWKHLKKIIKNRFDWSIENEFHLWKPNSKPFTDILLYQDTKHLSSFNLDKIRVDYEDRYLGNPILPSLKLVFSKTTVSNTSSGENTTERKLFLLRPNKSLVSKGLKSQSLIKSDNSLNVSSAPWREKDNLYLAGRTLALNFDSTWRYASDFPYTVFQRRFHKTLIPSDNIELVFKNKLPTEILEGIVCNIRIAYSGSSQTLHVIPFHSMRPTSFQGTNKSTLQLDLSNIKSKALKIGEIPLVPATTGAILMNGT